uniref:Proteasome subunit beta type-2 n=1 Tax=Schistosoma haematobium TaxID=6185 RepID=A0A094ZXJ8_SCHHA
MVNSVVRLTLLQGYELTPSAAANFTRNNMAESLRSRVPFAVHGYGALVALSILDRMHRPDMTVNEAVALLRLCIQEVQKRLVINLDRYMVRIVTKDGIEELPDLTDFAVKE